MADLSDSEEGEHDTSQMVTQMLKSWELGEICGVFSPTILPKRSNNPANWPIGTVEKVCQLNRMGVFLGELQNYLHHAISKRRKVTKTGRRGTKYVVLADLDDALRHFEDQENLVDPGSLPQIPPDLSYDEQIELNDLQIEMLNVHEDRLVARAKLEMAKSEYLQSYVREARLQLMLRNRLLEYHNSSNEESGSIPSIHQPVIEAMQHVAVSPANLHCVPSTLSRNSSNQLQLSTPPHCILNTTDIVVSAEPSTLKLAMSPRSYFETPGQVMGSLFHIIQTNWGLEDVIDALPNTLNPYRAQYAMAWGVDLVMVLASLSHLTQDRVEPQPQPAHAGVRKRSLPSEDDASEDVAREDAHQRKRARNVAQSRRVRRVRVILDDEDDERPVNDQVTANDDGSRQPVQDEVVQQPDQANQHANNMPAAAEARPAQNPDNQVIPPGARRNVIVPARRLDDGIGLTMFENHYPIPQDATPQQRIELIRFLKQRNSDGRAAALNGRADVMDLQTDSRDAEYDYRIHLEQVKIDQEAARQREEQNQN
ncbi:hypothetical protein FB567DRAFT_553748 [Paraphoma chrysanthemicola]|uniref:Uncharacterized protein n=1 Tax=Paraphoma chrysanthemicola TaxID=798071 RepID=A0A8K0VUA3_9PLEO|nr:hypothetical protein FB567DRAFT_553748 [Paraphoma chrysanthemicola]